MILRLSLLLALLTTSLTGYAQVYKCTQDGKTVFTDRPCEYKQNKIQVTPSSGDGLSNDAYRNNNSDVVQRLKADNEASEAARAAKEEAARQRRIEAEQSAAKQRLDTTQTPIILHNKNGTIRQPVPDAQSGTSELDSGSSSNTSVPK